MQAAGCPPNRLLYNGIRFCLEKAGQKEEALTLDRRKGGAGQGASEGDVSKAIERLGRQGRWEEAVEVFEEERREKGEVPGGVWTKLLEVFAR